MKEKPLMRLESKVSTAFLAPVDVERLTGFKRFSAQSRWLSAHGFSHEVNALGHPVVLWSAVQRNLTPKPRRRVQPNFQALTNGQKTKN